MPESAVQLLLLCESDDVEQQVRRALAERPGSVTRVGIGADLLAVLERSAADLVIVQTEQQALALELLSAVQTRWPSLAIILWSRTSAIDSAVATTAGASDVLTQPMSDLELTFAVQKVLSAAERIAAAAPPPVAGGSMVFGGSPAMQAVRELIAQIAPTNSTVLVRGESGTGKELVARSLHRLGERSAQPLIKIDCTSLPENLLESELFGYERGAFTGASGTKPGRVELAEGGTLFLDEVGELTLTIQAKLLRLLQDREFERLGGTKTIHVNIRVVAATHRDLEGMVQKGQFREDLFYRLNVLPVWLPPLRARRVDIEDLARHFCAVVAAASGKPDLKIAPDAMQVLLGQRWPGNVRQLQNFVERLVVLTPGSTIDAARVNAELGRPVRFQTETGPAGADAVRESRAPASASSNGLDSGLAVPLNEALRIAERDALVRALKHTAGNRSAAARLLAVSRSTLYNKLVEYGLL